MAPFSERPRFERLYDEYHRLVRSVLFSMTGERALDDLTQETFMKIWKGLPRFAFRSSIRTWVYRITINTAVDHLRRRGLRSGTVADTEIVEATPAPEANERDRALVRAALVELDEAHRSVVVLYYFEDVPLGEIASVLEIPEGTVKSRLHHARARMKEFLTEKGVAV